MEVNNIIARLALNGYKVVLLPNEEIEVSRWRKARRFDLKGGKYDYDTIVKEFVLYVYGFADETIEKLLAGKTVAVAYGSVSLYKNTLKTSYEDGSIKIENLL